MDARAGSYYLLDELQTNPAARSFQLSVASDQAVANSSASGTWFTPDAQAPILLPDAKLIPAESAEAFERQRWNNIGEKLASGFAKTFRKLGIPVTMAAIVGVCLLESGAAARIVSAIMSLLGPRGTAPALTISGFLLGIPVFFDNVFYLLLPLAKAVGRQHPTRYLAAVMSIIVGATMAHSLVPPTPGPLLVAAAMNINLGMMMLGGLVVGGLAASVGLSYGLLCSRWWPLAVEPASVSITATAVADSTPDTHEGVTAASDAGVEPEHRIPLGLALLPIAVPICLLGAAAISKSLPVEIADTPTVQLAKEWLASIDDPGLIFIASALLAIVLLRVYSNARVVQQSVARGISDAGTIVLLTCSGGAFGAALQQLDLATAIAGRFTNLTTPWGLLLTAFVLTAVIRAAQGSATVAMITSVAIIAPLAESLPLPFHPLYLALAIGCGSKPLPWMNDSGFWQVATMTGMSTTQTLKTFSVALTLMGLSGFVFTLLGAWLVPLV
ncbi:MAG: SLC13 family permease [Pirellulaceae bacterium]